MQFLKKGQQFLLHRFNIDPETALDELKIISSSLSRDVSIEFWQRQERDARRIIKGSDIDVWENSKLLKDFEKILVNAAKINVDVTKKWTTP